MKVSVIIPTLNEKDGITSCIRKIKRVFEEHKIEGEIIVSDSSSDETPKIAEELGAKVVRPDKLGYGYAYLYAFRHASGDYIVIGDGDDTYDFLEIPKLLEPLMKDEADIVIGSRFKGKIEKGSMSFLHLIGNKILTSFLNIFFKAKVSDAHSGFRAFKREALEKMKLNAEGMEFASEMVVEALRRNLRIKEVPINYYRRKGRAKIRSFSDGKRHLEFMLLYAPNYLYVIPGILILVFGIFMMAASYLRLNIGYTPGIHSMILGSLLTILGYQVSFLGILIKSYGLKRDLFDADRITRFALKIESKILKFGLVLFLLGLLYSLFLLYEWASSDYKILPVRGENMIAFTLLIIGLQTFFFSFAIRTVRS